MNATPTRFSREALAPFFVELRALGAELRADQRPEDRRQFLLIETAGRLLSLLGLATAWLAINPISIGAMALGSMIRWAIMAHHVLHGAFDTDPEAPARWKSKVFGQGWRRVVDWLDWIPPTAWSFEHNSLHHYRLGEDHDPDVPERTFAWMRALGLPRLINLASVLPMAMLWRPVYYGPNTVRQLVYRKQKEVPPNYDLFDKTLFSHLHPTGRAVWAQSLLPILVLRFALLPALFLPLGWGPALTVLANLVLAELVVGLHTFLIIVPNHAGDDILRFSERPAGRDEAILRQIVGSTNYRTGGLLRDVLHGYLNYQIEHHVWPDLSPGQLARAQPRLAALCAAYDVPYHQHPVWTRFRFLVANLIGDVRMPQVAKLLR